jgi:hypothetical protein
MSSITFVEAHAVFFAGSMSCGPKSCPMKSVPPRLTGADAAALAEAAGAVAALLPAAAGGLVALPAMGGAVVGFAAVVGVAAAGGLPQAASTLAAMTAAVPASTRRRVMMKSFARYSTAHLPVI